MVYQNNFSKILRLFILGLSLIPLAVKAQSLKVSVNPSVAEIADHVQYIVEVTKAGTEEIQFPVFDTYFIPEIEVISDLPVDTLNNAGKLTFVKKYILTSFKDSVYILPSIKVSIGNKTYVSDSLKVTFGRLQIDSTLLSKIDTSEVVRIFDIKSPKQAPWTFKEFWQQYGTYILIALFVALLLVFIIIFVVKRKQNKPVIPFKKSVIPPHVTANQALQKLKDKKLWQREKYKEYYTELTDILRNYMAVSFGIHTLEQTSHEILAALKVRFSDKDANFHRDITFLFETSDLVKFAKYIPIGTDNDNCMQYAFDFIQNTFIPEVNVKTETAETIASDETLKNNNE